MTPFYKEQNQKFEFRTITPAPLMAKSRPDSFQKKHYSDAEKYLQSRRRESSDTPFFNKRILNSSLAPQYEYA